MNLKIPDKSSQTQRYMFMCNWKEKTQNKTHKNKILSKAKFHTLTLAKPSRPRPYCNLKQKKTVGPPLFAPFQEDFL